MTITGQVPPVVLSGGDLAELDGRDDPSAFRERFTGPDPKPDPRSRSWGTRVGRGALIAFVVLAAMVPVAFAVR